MSVAGRITTNVAIQNHSGGDIIKLFATPASVSKPPRTSACTIGGRHRITDIDEPAHEATELLRTCGAGAKERG